LEPGDVATTIVKSRHDSADDGEILPRMPVIDPSELIGCTFLMYKEDGQRHCARILNVIDEEEICKRIGEHEHELFRQPGMYNLFALSMMMTTKRSFPTMS
jgi:hypothetical protein